MAKYSISGIWKGDDEVITHYAMHRFNTDGTIDRALKTSKVDAIKLVEDSTNIVFTWMWNYKLAGWETGENVHVVKRLSGKYLRSNPDSTATDNLNHLVNYDWL